MSKYYGPVTTGIKYSNGRKDKGFKFLIQLTPSRIEDALRKVKEIERSLKDYRQFIKDKPEKYDLERKEF